MAVVRPLCPVLYLLVSTSFGRHFEQTSCVFAFRSLNVRSRRCDQVTEHVECEHKVWPSNAPERADDHYKVLSTIYYECMYAFYFHTDCHCMAGANGDLLDNTTQTHIQSQLIQCFNALKACLGAM